MRAQGLTSVANSATQILVVLRLLEMVGGHAVAAVTGIAFGLSGVATSGAAIFYTVVTRRIGYVRTTVIAAVLMAVAIALIAVAPWVAVVVGAVGVERPSERRDHPGHREHDRSRNARARRRAPSSESTPARSPLASAWDRSSQAAWPPPKGVPAAIGVIAVIALGLAVLLAVGTREPAR